MGEKWSPTLCPKDGGNGHLQGAADPWGRPTLWWARSAYPLAWSGQWPFQTHSRWDFVQIPNGLLVFYFPTNFYQIFNFYNYCKNDN
jgi:hypothetical protein